MSEAPPQHASARRPWWAAVAAGLLWGSSLPHPVSAVAVLLGALLLPATLTGHFRGDVARGILFATLWYGLSLTWFPTTWNTYWGTLGLGIWLGFVGLQLPVAVAVHAIASRLDRWALPLGWAAAVPLLHWIQPLPADPALLLGEAPILLWPAALGGRQGLNLVLLGWAALCWTRPRAGLLLLGGWLGTGAVWLAIPLKGPVNRVALVQPNTGAFDGRRMSTATDRGTHLLDLLDQAAATDPDWIATPEGAWPLWVGDHENAPFRKRFLSEWPELPPVVLGASPRRDGIPANGLVVVDDGVTDRFDKRYLVPLAEEVRFGLGHTRYRRGTQPRVLSVGETRVAPLICYEDLLEPALTEAASGSAHVLLSATNDVWSGPGRPAHQHLMGARLAAVSTGRWVVRATTSGLSGFVDPRGRVWSQTPFGDGDSAPIPGQVRVQELQLLTPAWTGQQMGRLLSLLALLALAVWWRR